MSEKLKKTLLEAYREDLIAFCGEEGKTEEEVEEFRMVWFKKAKNELNNAKQEGK